jgi:hypothetical protein
MGLMLAGDIPIGLMLTGDVSVLNLRENNSNKGRHVQ